jgi:triosephosphate isomerase
MNGLTADGLALAGELAALMKQAGSDPGFDMLVCPPATLIGGVGSALASSGISLGGQDCHDKSGGAHTGDIAAAMLADLGCSHVIVGHSERRTDHGETSADVAAKASAAVDAGLIPVICVGETEAEKDAGRTMEVLGAQIAGSVPSDLGATRFVVAYEPVWAIGTGRTPTAAEANDIHAGLRKLLEKKVGDVETVRILYGGSVKPSNAAEFLSMEHIDGALVGGASLKAQDFWGIAQVCAGQN